jgi:glycosyltransferase involved in cell wall biosynthesis
VPIHLKKDFQRDFCDFHNIEPIFVDYSKFSLKGFIGNSKVLKKLNGKVDVYFYPHVNLPFYIPRNTVVTVHDLIPLTSHWNGGLLKKRVFSFYLSRALHHSAQVITISDTVAGELKAHFSGVANKIQTIYRFVDSKFDQFAAPKPFLDTRYLLFVGNRKKHKNIEQLLRAFNQVKHLIPHSLVLAGAKDSEKDDIDHLIDSLGIQDRVISIMNPTDDQIISLYYHADLFIFPSFFEGFGLPPLEAVQLGCPVILSDIPIFKEIFASSGRYFDPHNQLDLAKAILDVVTNRQLRFELLSKQKERISLFDLKKAIDQHISLFQYVIGGNS